MLTPITARTHTRTPALTRTGARTHTRQTAHARHAVPGARPE